MTEPRVPGGRGAAIDLPCGETVSPGTFDLGMREYDCACGASHAVVMDIHPLARFVPEFFVDTLRETIETDDEFEEFTTAHALAMVREEFPDQVVSVDRSDDGHVGYALLWVADFDSRRLHEVVVELLVELVEHAVSHADDDATLREFETHLQEFDVAAVVDAYREEREFEDEYDTAI
jgi:hypothetical protein